MPEPISHVTKLVDYLLWLVVALTTWLFTLWNKHLNSRLNKVEAGVGKHDTTLTEVKVAIEKRFSQHEKEEFERAASHEAQVSHEFKELRREVTSGHHQILDRVNQLALEIRKNGNGNGRT